MHVNSSIKSIDIITLLLASAPRICSRATQPFSSIKETQLLIISRLKDEICEISSHCETPASIPLPQIIVPLSYDLLMKTFVPAMRRLVKSYKYTQYNESTSRTRTSKIHEERKGDWGSQSRVHEVQ